MIAALAAAAGFARPAAASTLTVAQAFADLNGWRQLAGEPPVLYEDPNLSHGCQLHNAYLATNRIGGHDEDPTLPGYSQLGAQAGSSSVLVDAEMLPRVGFERAVFHRLALLQPRLQTSWYDANFGNTCMGVFGLNDAVRTPVLTLYPWPFSNQRRVPVDFATDEFPSPYDDAPGAQRLGYPLSVQVNGPWSGSDSVTVADAQLVSDRSGPTRVVSVDANSVHGDVLSGGFALLPFSALGYHQWYTASVSGTVSTAGLEGTTVSVPFVYNWRFETDWPTPRLSITTWSDGRVQARSSSRAPVKITYSRGAITVSQWTRPLRRVVARVRGRWAVCLDQRPRGHWAAAHVCYPAIRVGR
ncbi:MAG TPA: hypothetical protein VFY36_04490 [Solirubrobacteraceae bacterium]|nr:hypothetical protein [Solirubrobacteraceae bacterium]